MDNIQCLESSIKKCFEYLSLASKEFNEAQKFISELKIESEKTGTSADDYLSKDDFMKILNISNSTFCKWEREGKMKVTRLGKGITYIHKSELEKLLKSAA